MKRIGVTVLQFPVKSLPYVAPRFAPRMVSRKDKRLASYLPYISLMILATAALGASASRAFDFFTDSHPCAGISRNVAVHRGMELCQALTYSSALTASAESITTIEGRTGRRHNEWEITCRDGNASYVLKLDAKRNCLTQFQKEPRPLDVKSEEPVRSETGDHSEYSRAAIIEMGRHYLIATGLAAGTPSMRVLSALKTSDGRLWDIFCVYTSAQGDRRKARIGIVVQDGSLDRLQTM